MGPDSEITAFIGICIDFAANLPLEFREESTDECEGNLIGQLPAGIGQPGLNVKQFLRIAGLQTD